MKKCIYLLLFFAVYSCVQPGKGSLIISSQDLLTKSSNKDIYQVNDLDIQAYVHYLSVNERFKGNDVKSVKGYNKNGHLVYYGINLENGWLIISADKRGPIILAKSPEGQYETELSCEAVQSWFDSIADEIIFRKEHPNEYYVGLSEQSKDNEARCLDFWRAITADESFIAQQLDKPNRTVLHGTRSLAIVHSRLDSLESLDHLIPVYWHQREPFNLYCPLIAQDSLTRCPAGCAPLAVAQTAYYLHYYIDCPDFTPSTGSCVGWYGSYSQSFSNLSTYTWDAMAYSNDPFGFAALYIGFLGKAMSVNYTPTLTTTSFNKMANVLASHLGLNYLTGSINYDIVYSNLHSNIPVICAAYKMTANGLMLHAFILDGYEALYFENSYEYYGSPETDRTTITLLEPIMTHVRINWGSGLFGRNSTYAVTGTWEGFDSCRTIIYDLMSENK